VDKNLSNDRQEIFFISFSVYNSTHVDAQYKIMLLLKAKYTR